MIDMKPNMKLEIDWTARDNSSMFKVQSYMKADFSDLVSAFQSRVYCLVFVVCVENLSFFSSVGGGGGLSVVHGAAWVPTNIRFLFNSSLCQ